MSFPNIELVQATGDTRRPVMFNGLMETVHLLKSPANAKHLENPSSDYGVTVLDLTGCFSAGSTSDEAVNNTEEAIFAHIERLFMGDDIVPLMIYSNQS